MAGAPLPVGGPKPALTTAGASWPSRGGPQYSASVAGGVLQRTAAPSVAASGPSTPAFGNGQLTASSAGSATAAGHAKQSTAGGGSGVVPAKCPYSSAAMSSNHAADFNPQIKYATTAALFPCTAMTGGNVPLERKPISI